MQNSLLETIKMDLDIFPFKEEEKLKAYARWLLGEAYLGKDGDTNTHRYVSEKDNLSINNEIRSLVYNGNVMLDYNKLLDAVTDVIVDDYVKNKYNEEKENVEVKSFNEVMEKTLSYYQEKFNSGDKNEVIKFAQIILSDYFDNKHVYVFSSKNGTRTYVTQRNPEQILNEMSKELNMISSVPSAIISVYANKVANDWISKRNSMVNYGENVLNNFTNMIISEINRASLNDRQKAYLINEFQNGNIDALERYIPQNLIDEYKKVNTSLNDGNYSK